MPGLIADYFAVVLAAVAEQNVIDSGDIGDTLKADAASTEIGDGII